MGEFAKVASEVEPVWEKRIAEQQGRMNQIVPSSSQEATVAALKSLMEMKNKAHALGYTLRSLSQQQGLKELMKELEPTHMPGREMLIDLPALKEGSCGWVEDKMWSKEAGIFGALTDPIRYGAQDAKAELARIADESIGEGTRTTSDPKTLPWYYPAMAATVPHAFTSGYRKAETDAETSIKSEMAKRVESARMDFEKALEEEYRHSRRFKEGSAVETPGELIDGLAQLHIEKKAEGELNTAAGMYLALATLLGMGSYQLGKSWTEKNDPRYQRLKAMKDVIKQRMRQKPLPILVSSEPLQGQETNDMGNGGSLTNDVEPATVEKMSAVRVSQKRNKEPKDKEDEGTGERLSRYGRNLALGTGAAAGGVGALVHPIVSAGKPIIEARDIVRKAPLSESRIGVRKRMDVPEGVYQQAGPKYIQGANNALNAKVLGTDITGKELHDKLLGILSGLGDRYPILQAPKDNQDHPIRDLFTTPEPYEIEHVEGFAGRPTEGNIVDRDALRQAIRETEHVSNNLAANKATFEDIYPQEEQRVIKDHLAAIKEKGMNTGDMMAETLSKPQHKNVAAKVGRHFAYYSPPHYGYSSPAENWGGFLSKLRALPYISGGVVAGGLGLEALRRYLKAKPKEENVKG